MIENPHVPLVNYNFRDWHEIMTCARLNKFEKIMMDQCLQDILVIDGVRLQGHACAMQLL